MHWLQVLGQCSFTFITQEDVAGYAQVFVGWPVSEAGTVSVEALQGVLTQSQLDRGALARIWEMTCVLGAPGITFSEFCVALHLAKTLLNCGSMPEMLPASVRTEMEANWRLVQQQTRSSTPAPSANALGLSGLPPPQTATQAPRQTEWAISGSQKAAYDEIFKAWDVGNTGHIGGEKARLVFGNSQLPEHVLAHVWSLADTHNTGKLNSDEFAVAMHLVQLRMANHELPATLPPELVPPSTRDLDAMTSMLKHTLATGSSPAMRGRVFSTAGRAASVASNDSGRASNAVESPQPDPQALARMDELKRQRETLNAQIEAASARLKSAEALRASAAARAAAQTASLAEERRATRAKADELRAAAQKRLDAAEQRQRSLEAQRRTHVEDKVPQLRRALEQRKSALAQLAQLASAATAANARTGDSTAAGAPLETMQTRLRGLLDQCRLESGRRIAVYQQLIDLRLAPGRGGVSGGLNISKLLDGSSANAARPVSPIAGGAEDPIAAKARAMLAERLQALGVSPALESKPAVAKTETDVASAQEVQRLREMQASLEGELADRAAAVEALLKECIRHSGGGAVDAAAVARVGQLKLALEVSLERLGAIAKKLGPEFEGSTVDFGTIAPTASAAAPPMPAVGTFGNASRETPLEASAGARPAPWAFTQHSEPLTVEKTLAEKPAEQPLAQTPATNPFQGASTNPFHAARAAFLRQDSVPVSKETANKEENARANSRTTTGTPDAAPAKTSATEAPSATAVALARSIFARAEAAAAAANALVAPASSAAALPLTNAKVSMPSSAAAAPRGSTAAASSAVAHAPASLSVSSRADAAVVADPPEIVLVPRGTVRSAMQGLSSGGSFSGPVATGSARSRAPSESLGSQPPVVKLDSSAPRGSIVNAPAEPKAEVPVRDVAPSLVVSQASPPRAAVSSQSSQSKFNPHLGTAERIRQQVMGAPPADDSDSSGGWSDSDSEAASAKPAVTPSTLANWGRPEPVALETAKSRPAEAKSSQVGVEKPKVWLSELQRAPASLRAPAENVAPVSKAWAPVSKSAPAASNQAADEPSSTVTLQQTEAPVRKFSESSKTGTVREKLTALRERGLTDTAEQPPAAVKRSTTAALSETSSNLGRFFPAAQPATVAASEEPQKTKREASPESQPPHEEKVRVVWAYEPEEPDSTTLSLLPGQTLAVQGRQDEWLYGRLLGGAATAPGWFPAAYVEPVANVDEAVQPAVVLYDFDGTAPPELSVAAGTAVLAQRADEYGIEWMWVTVETGEEGIVPTSYLELEPSAGSPTRGDASLFSSGVKAPVTPGARVESLASTSSVEPVSTTTSSFQERRAMFQAAGAREDLPGKPERHTRAPSGQVLVQKGSFAARLDTTLSIGRSRSVSAEIPPPAVPSKGRAAPPPTRAPEPPLASLSADTSLRTPPPRPEVPRWANSVPEQVLAMVGAEERKRQEAIFELIATEERYVRDIRLLVDVLQPLVRRSLNAADTRAIFANADEIAGNSTRFLAALKQVQERDACMIGEIGGAFVEHHELFNAYIEYCANQLAASKLLVQRRQAQPALESQLRACQRDARFRSLDLSSFLLEPMQRITRYALLLRQILHHTGKYHADHAGVTEALALVEALLARVNDAARVRESDDRIAELILELEGDSSPAARMLDLSATTRTLGKRRLVREGPLSKAKSGRRLLAVLFNDLLLLLTDSGSSSARRSRELYGEPLRLGEIVARPVPANARERSSMAIDEACFQVIRGELVITLRAPSSSERTRWLEALDANCSACIQAERDARRPAEAAPPAQTRPIGTLQVIVLEGVHLAGATRGRGQIYCSVQVGHETQKTRIAREADAPRWNQTLIFSLSSLDDELRLSLYAPDRYSQDAYLGSARLPLDFLEYYGDKETERILVNLVEFPHAHVALRLGYRSA